MTRAREIATQGGLVLISSTTIGSAVSSVVISNAFSATYDNYKILLSGGVGSTEITLRMKLGSTTTNYYSMVSGLLFTGSSDGGANNNNVPYMNWVGTANSQGINMDFNLQGPFLAKNTYANGFFIQHVGGAQGGFFATSILKDTTSYTDFTLTPSSGTLTGGIIEVYGYK